jgi:hypothetical protein
MTSPTYTTQNATTQKNTQGFLAFEFQTILLCIIGGDSQGHTHCKIPARIRRWVCVFLLCAVKSMPSCTFLYLQLFYYYGLIIIAG